MKRLYERGDRSKIRADLVDKVERILARLDQARAVQALTNPHDSRPDASSQRGI